MPNILFWKNVGIDVQTALSAAQTVTAISKAATGVITYSGTDPANGDYIVLTSNGMHQVNDRIFRLANVNAGSNTAELEGEATTDYDTFTSGSFEIVTFGASFASTQNINASGGELQFDDITTVHDNVRKEAPTLANGMTMDMENFFDVSDPGWIECNKAYKAQGAASKRAIRLRFGSTHKMVFLAYPGAAGVPTGQAQGAVKTNVSLKGQGIPTLYST